MEIDDADPTKGTKAAAKMLDAAGLAKTDENIFIAACCKEKGISFLKGEAKVSVRMIEKEAAPKPAVAKALATAPTPDGYTVTVNSKTYAVKLEGGDAMINGKRYAVTVKDGIAASAATGGLETGTGGCESVKAPMPGTIFKLRVEPGDSVNEGDELVVLEAMKMEVPVKAHVSGTVASVEIAVGGVVSAGQTLLTIG
jgi:pyruvate carboxylase subunit B